MILLLDIGNTHTHLGLGDERGVRKRADFPTSAWGEQAASRHLRRLAGGSRLQGAAVCSVVPSVTNTARRAVRSIWPLPWFDLTAQTARCRLGIRYPKPETIGPDRLANAIAARHHFGAPCLAIDFGTAVTFDAIDDTGSFVGGIIAPGVSLMTRYLHDQTALLPEVRLRPVRGGVGRSTEQAMLIAATYGFAGMVQALILQVKRHLARRRLPVVATGGYARQIARRLPEITAVVPHLTLEGLRLAWHLGLESPAAAPTLRSHESH